MAAPDARYDDTTASPHFAPRYQRIAWRVDGEYHWSRLYTPSPEALRWDGAEWANAAIGSRNYRDDGPCFSYVELRQTGRAPVVVPNTGGRFYGTRGLKGRVTFCKGTPDESTLDCWTVDNYDRNEVTR